MFPDAVAHSRTKSQERVLGIINNVFITIIIVEKPFWTEHFRIHSPHFWEPRRNPRAHCQSTILWDLDRTDFDRAKGIAFDEVWK
mmetsp:Transcript_282/g.482  ORF Transcript_282/g.482 Transcript_282/m.482 type:complete len:85 (-) Transcript_282:1217-1471(-)